MPEHRFAAEILEIRVLYPPVAQRLVREIVHMFEDEQPGHQPCWQWRLPRPYATYRAEALRQKIPINLRREPHQRMAKIDDLLQRRAKQIVLAGVAPLAHGSSFTANLAVKGIMSPATRKSQNPRNPTSPPGFLAKSITCSGQITTINQSLPNSSRATTYRRVPRLRRYEAAGAGFDRTHPRTPNKLAGNAQNNLHLRSYGGLTAHLGG